MKEYNIIEEAIDLAIKNSSIFSRQDIILINDALTTVKKKLDNNIVDNIEVK